MVNGHTGMSSFPGRTVKLFSFAVGIFLVLAVCLEIAVGIVLLIEPRLFGKTATVDAAIDNITPKEFTTVATQANGNPSVWDAREGTTTNSNCLGQMFDASYDQSGARIYSGYDPKSATVLLIGDSYTAGDEVGNENTVAAHLFRHTGIISANLGVGGYGPLQAVLKFEEKAKDYPSAKIVVLGIMYENIRRNVNSYMAVFTGAEGVFAVRPYVGAGAVKMVPGEIFTSLDKFKSYTRTALESDFWATPSPSFPNTLALIRLIKTRSFWIRNKSRVLKFFGRQYEPDYSDPDLKEALSVVVKRFGEAAKVANLRPFVIFIPQSRFDLNSPVPWIKKFNLLHGDEINIRIMDLEDVDWERYNLRTDGSCHPSSYGYEMIAKAYARALGEQVGAR